MLTLASLLAGTGALYLVQEVTKPGDKQPKMDILVTRDEDDLSQETNDLIDLITVDPETFPVGSFKYRAHKYPGDIDIFEPIKACCTRESAKKTIAQKLQGVIKKIDRNNEIFLGDFKAGIDDRFKIDIGKLENEKVKGYNQNQVIDELSDLRAQKLLTQEQYDDLVKMASKKMDVKNWEDLNDALRSFYVVRWTIPEAVAGEQKLPGNKTLKLEDAITHDSIVKLDIWAKNHGRYNEITNFFLIVLQDKMGNETVLNAELGDRLKSLAHDIEKYSSKEHRNSLKLAKRLWNKALFEKDEKMYKKLFPLFSSDAAMLNQIVGESEVLRLMLEKLPANKLPLKDMIKQIDQFKERLNNTFEIQTNTDNLNRLIDQIVDQYEIYGNKVNKKLIVDNLTALEKGLKKPIEEYSKNYLKSVGINL